MLCCRGWEGKGHATEFTEAAQPGLQLGSSAPSTTSAGHIYRKSELHLKSSNFPRKWDAAHEGGGGRWKERKKKDCIMLCVFRVWDSNARQALLFLSLVLKGMDVENLKWKNSMASNPFKKLRFCEYRIWDGSVTKPLCCAVAHQSQKTPKGHISSTMSSRLCMQL